MLGWSWSGTGRAVLARLSGEIDLSNAGEVEDQVTGGLGGATAVAVDLSGLSYLDSAGLALLSRLAGRLSALVRLAPAGGAAGRVRRPDAVDLRAGLGDPGGRDRRGGAGRARPAGDAAARAGRRRCRGSGGGSACPGWSTCTCTSCRRGCWPQVWAYFDGPRSTTARPGRSRYRDRRRASGSPCCARSACGRSRRWLPAQARDGGLAQRLDRSTSPRARPDCVPVGDVLPRAGRGGVRPRRARPRRPDLQGAPAGRRRTTRTTRCSTRSGARWPRRVRRSVVHCGNGPRRARTPGPARSEAVLRRHPGLVLVVAHAGLPDYLRVPRAGRPVAAGAPGHHDGVHPRSPRQPAPLPAGCRPGWPTSATGCVLGTDFPNIPYPYRTQLDALAGLDLGDDWLRGCWAQRDAAARARAGREHPRPGVACRTCEVCPPSSVLPGDHQRTRVASPE